MKKQVVGPKEEKDDEKENEYDFRVYSCGTKGGGYASQLTSFLIAEVHDKYNFLSMDAGTSNDCLRAGSTEDNKQLGKILDPGWKENQGSLESYLQKNDVGYFRQQQVNGFLVTHAHLDHLTGLVISSPDEKIKKGGAHKPIIATSAVMDGVKQALNRPSWPNMIMLGFYDTKKLDPSDGEKPMTELDGSGVFGKSKMKIQSYLLSHDNSLGESQSTAFKICNSDKDKSCILFLGDTASDDAEWINVKKYVVPRHFKSKAAKDFLGAGPGAELIKKVRSADELEAVLPISKHGFPDLKDNSQLGQHLTAKENTAGGEEKENIGKDLDNFETKVRAMLEGFNKYSHIYSEIIREKEKKIKPLKVNDLLGRQFHPLRDLWTNVMPDIAAGILHTIFIECSYADSRPEELWFGHMVPKTIIDELEYLDLNLQKNHKTKGKIKLSVVVMHIKPTFGFNEKDEDSYKLIKKQLEDHLSKKDKKTKRKWDRLDIKLIFPQQTDLIYLKRGLHAKLDPHTSSSNAHREMDNLLVSDFGDDSDGEVDYGNVNGHFMHHREPQYGPKWHDSYHHKAGYEEGGRGYYLAPAVPSSHYQSHLDVNLILFTTILMFLCICMCCASFLCGFSVRQVIRKLIKTKRYHRVYQDEIEHDHVV